MSVSRAVSFVLFVVIAAVCSNALTSCADETLPVLPTEDSQEADVSGDGQEDVSDEEAQQEPETEPEAEEEVVGQAQFGEMCEDDADCESHLCLSTWGLNLCTDYCTDDCPDGWTCTYFSNSGPDVIRMCVPDSACLDADGDDYGIGPDCIGSDCNDEDANVNPGATEVCNYEDTNCDELMDNLDMDNDGAYACDSVEPFDCDDGDETITPNANEVCDGVDNDCDGLEDNVDMDGDGYSRCRSVFDMDCDDEDDSIHPYAVEECDEVDNDCDGQIDEEVKTTFYFDGDGDGYGNTLVSLQACEAPPDYVESWGDCNDNNDQMYPTASEVCDDLDNDCNDLVDDGLTQITSYRDADGDEFGALGASHEGCDIPPGYVLPVDFDEDDQLDWDCDDLALAINPQATEACTNGDTDCNGFIDDVDGDEDGYYACPSAGDRQDCRDDNTDVHPGQVEVCNTIDDNCNSQIDEGVLITFYRDQDIDGFGDNSATQQGCSAPDGFVEQGDDCHDNDVTIYPGAAELCDGKDNDCNGLRDDAIGLTTIYRDADTDGFGSLAESREACNIEDGWVLARDIESDGQWDWDCNDLDSDSHPGAEEICNSKDSDCNGIRDDVDVDDDGFYGCMSAGSNRDCNDGIRDINPGAIEVCNEVDDNCNTLVDEGVLTTFYFDNDSDLWGDNNATIEACEAPERYVAVGGDCNEYNSDIHPEAQEVCNDTDDDCNGLDDDGLTLVTYYGDGDQDGFASDIAQPLTRCAVPVGFTTEQGDCDDSDSTVFPGAPDICDGKDNGCNGYTDRFCATKCEGLWQTRTIQLEGESSSPNMIAADMDQDGIFEIVATNHVQGALFDVEGNLLHLTEGGPNHARRPGVFADLDGVTSPHFTLEWVYGPQSALSFVRLRDERGAACDVLSDGFRQVAYIEQADKCVEFVPAVRMCETCECSSDADCPEEACVLGFCTNSSSRVSVYDAGYFLARDINRDGRMDVVVPDWASGMKVATYFGNAGALVLTSDIPFPDGKPMYTNGIALADIDSDDMLEIIYGGGYNSSLYANNWSGNIYALGVGADYAAYDACPGCYETALATGEPCHPGDECEGGEPCCDVGWCSDDNLCYYYKMGVNSLYVADMDGDGVDEIETSVNYMQTNVHGQQNSSAGTHHWNFSVGGAKNQGPPDEDNPNFCYYEDNDGDGEPECQSSMWTVMHDMDGDRDLDQVYVSGNRIVVRLWDGEGFRIMPAGLDIGGSGTVQYVGQLDQDNRLDVLISQPDGTLYCVRLGEDTHHPWTSRGQMIGRQVERTFQRDNWEPNDTMDTAYAVHYDKDIMHGTIGAPGDEDWFRLVSSYDRVSRIQAPQSHGLRVQRYADDRTTLLVDVEIQAGQSTSIGYGNPPNHGAAWIRVTASDAESFSTTDPWMAWFIINW